MAHESFEDEDVARALNAGFVAVKVDREERPDIDAVYMAATTALTGHGGWPMTCVLTPDGDPFFAGTYFPKGQFLQLLAGVDGRVDRRSATGSSTAGRTSRRGCASCPRRSPGTPSTRPRSTRAVAQLRGQFDHGAAGFGGAPKFPPSMVLEFLLRHHARTGSADALAMAASTCEAMARGGIYDQLGGGFARYSVDARWVVPHFEKMLYDNAQLLRVYTHLHRATGDAAGPAGRAGDGRVPAARPAHRRGRLRLGARRGHRRGRGADLRLDARPARRGARATTDGRAGRELLLASPTAGTFEHGSSTLQLLADPDDPAWWAATRGAAARRPGASGPSPAATTRSSRRGTGWRSPPSPRPGRSSTAPTSSQAARALRRVRRRHPPRRRAAAPHLAGRRGRRRRAAWPTTTATSPRGCSPCTRPPATRAGSRLPATCSPPPLDRFGADDGGFHDTSDDAEALFTRPRSAADNAEPSGQSALAGALLTCSALTGDPAMRERAEAALAASGQLAARDPRFGGWALAVAEAAAGRTPAGGRRRRPVPRRTRWPPSRAGRPRPGWSWCTASPTRPGIPLLAQRPAGRWPRGGIRVPWVRVRRPGDGRRGAHRGAGSLTQARAELGVRRSQSGLMPGRARR